MAKKKKAESPEAPSAEALFLSLMIILLAFFIMLNSIATLETDKITRAIRSINSTSSGLGVFGAGMSLDPNSKSPGGKAIKVVNLDRVYDIINQSLVKWGKGEDWVKFKEDERRLVISMDEAAMFGKAADTLNPRVFPLLDGLGELVERIGIPLTVQGHSDPTGSRPGGTGNWVISAHRATGVARYLIEGVGVAPSLIEAEAFAENRPIASNATTDGRAKNRRVDLVFYKRDLAGARIEVQ